MKRKKYIFESQIGRFSFKKQRFKNVNIFFCYGKLYVFGLMISGHLKTSPSALMISIFHNILEVK